MSSHWNRYCQYLVRYEDLGISLDVSRMNFKPGFLTAMQPKVKLAFADMKKLEKGGIVNQEEKRMVGHYWLRNAALAPAKLRAGIKADIAGAKRLPPPCIAAP